MVFFIKQLARHFQAGDPVQKESLERPGPNIISQINRADIYMQLEINYTSFLAETTLIIYTTNRATTIVDLT